MNKVEAIRTVLDHAADAPVVFTTGYACRIARGIADRPGHFYMTGSMGLASSIGAGLALQTGRTAIVVDGDGSVLMNPVGLLTVGALAALPLLQVVLDDGRYASTGGQAVPSRRVDLGALAGACGYRSVYETDRVEELAELLDAALPHCPGPVFVRCDLREPDPPVAPRIDADLPAHAARFARHVSTLGAG
ncbi:thiamine pyrophosphate-dependent enzyme [Catenulispora subtropica]|uniref:Sulfopyruvate decarboxylase subunit beta n=1 Tax=Catenulispora subtropica TaxID=450798 RepID=A0ABN2T2I9_9ACTN